MVVPACKLTDGLACRPSAAAFDNSHHSRGSTDKLPWHADNVSRAVHRSLGKQAGNTNDPAHVSDDHSDGTPSIEQPSGVDHGK